MSPAKAAPAVRFEATLYTIDGSTIARLPDKASKQLPSRGQIAVQATVNITPMARWDWVRWVNATQNPGTRQRRVEVSIEDAKREAPTVLFEPGVCDELALRPPGE